MLKFHKPSAFIGVAAFIVILTLGARLTLALTPDALKPLVQSLAGVVVDQACSAKVAQIASTHAKEMNQKDADCSAAMQAIIIADVEAMGKRTLHLCQRLAALEVIVCQMQNGGNARLCANLSQAEECQ